MLSLGDKKLSINVVMRRACSKNILCVVRNNLYTLPRKKFTMVIYNMLGEMRYRFPPSLHAEIQSLS